MPSDLAELDTTSPEKRALIARAILEDARVRAARALAGGAGGREVCRLVSDALDGVVGRLFSLALEGATPKPRVAVLATGGWGRRETCPYSDIDLLFLTAGPTDDRAVRELADRVLYPLWDSGLEVGHAVRTLDEGLTLAAEDLATATALLDARLVCGDAALAEELSRLLPSRLGRPDANAFVRRLCDEKRTRHARFGDSLYLLEPNLKHGQGGLRDLATGLWAAQVRWRVRDFADLVALGQLSARQAAVLTEARDFLLRLRAAAHLQAKRRQDQLSFELQEAIAPRFYPDARVREGEIRPAVAPAVETLMRRYYLHAKAVVRETDRLLERAVVPPARPPTVRRLDMSFTLWNGQLSANDPAVFRERPSEIVRLFRVALDEGVPIYGHTKDLVAELVATDAARLGDDPEARRHFVALLTDPRDAREPSLLEQMHDLGILAAMMPEFAPCTGRVQHDLYHVFTVDQHQLYAVALLKRIARGELAREAPSATEAAARIERPAPLYLGTLLHDVGKPLGKGHADKGARLAASIATRLGLPPEDVAQTEFLVKQHLLMSHLSQRRDLHDVALIASFADTVRDEETLRELYLLTYCDTASTAPGNLTEWKDMLLGELYERTRAYFRRGPDLAGADRSALVKRRRRRVGELLGRRPGAPELERWFAGLPDRYFALLEPKAIVRHVRLSEARGDRPAAIEVTHHPRKGFSEVAIVAIDAPGLLSKIAGVMLANRIDVIGAQIHSRSRAEAPGGVGEALDVFWVRDRYGRAIAADDPRWKRVEEDLARVLSGDECVEDLVRARREKGTLKARKTPGVPTEIEIDNDASEDFTVIDIFTQDRLGVLYAITRTLTELGLDIALSKVATEAERVADCFYVIDRETRAKVTDPTRLAELTRAIEAALAEVPS